MALESQSQTLGKAEPDRLEDQAGGQGLQWWLMVLLLGSGLGLLLRLSLFFLAAEAVHLVRAVAEGLFSLLPAADPVYTRASLATLTDVRIEGVAVAGALGTALHQLAPSVFVDAGRADATLVRLAVDPAGAALAIGLAMLRAGVRRRRFSLVVVGGLVQVQVALGIVTVPPSLDQLEATGLSFAVNVLMPWLTGRRVALSDLFVEVPAHLVTALLVALALLVAYLPFLLAVATGVLARRLSAIRRGQAAALGEEALPRRPGALGYTVGAVAAERAQGTAGAVATPSLAAKTVAMVTPGPTATPTPLAPPSKVEIRGVRYRYEYLVNGRRQLIKGMGLNIQYRRYLTPSDRAARLDADLAEMRRLGVNTVLGWSQHGFDQVLFDLAYQHSIGVIPPYDLDSSADYTDPAYRANLTSSVLAWVERYRRHPALRMWGLGNEVLHKIVHPAWVGPQDPQRERNARAFADWLLETAEKIHQLDPEHPVTFRDAEDAFVPWVAEALKRRGGSPRPWFAYGTNCCSDYLSSVVDRWPDRGLDVALWVSEFAPGGMAVAGRPEGFRKMWSYVRRRPQWVLGGAVYAWTRFGPEEIDRTLGITNDGRPVDQRLFQTLEAIFHEESGGAVGGARAPG